jgi:hypothetical protein
VANGSSIPEHSNGSARSGTGTDHATSRTAVIARLANTSLKKCGHMAQRSAGPMQADSARPIYLSSLAREVGRRAPRSFRVGGKDSAAIYRCWPVARCPSLQPSPASGARESSRHYQSLTFSYLSIYATRHYAATGKGHETRSRGQGWAPLSIRSTDLRGDAGPTGKTRRRRPFLPS